VAQVREGKRDPVIFNISTFRLAVWFHCRRCTGWHGGRLTRTRLLSSYMYLVWSTTIRPTSDIVLMLLHAQPNSLSPLVTSTVPRIQTPTKRLQKLHILFLDSNTLCMHSQIPNHYQTLSFRNTVDMRELVVNSLSKSITKCASTAS
jgi:hypothetical protein